MFRTYTARRKTEKRDTAVANRIALAIILRTNEGRRALKDINTQR